MSDHKNLNRAWASKNDEFYTQYSDVVLEMEHYGECFRDASVYCNCDCPKYSAFWRYFHSNFADLGLKKLASTFYSLSQPVCVAIYEGGNDSDPLAGDSYPLAGNGDFRNQECIELLKEADIVVTNPPFSLFREYAAQLAEYDKKFIILGNMNASHYRDFLPLIKDGKVWVGANVNGGTRKGNTLHFTTSEDYTGRMFIRDGIPMAAVPCWWFTNLKYLSEGKGIRLHKNYTPAEYPRYDNCDAVECRRARLIPKDYEGTIGVPCTFLRYYDPEQFEILGLDLDMTDDRDYLRVNGRMLYNRILIRLRHPEL